MLKEIVFDTALGRIAGICDSKEDNRPVIVALHGWLDNAASFERILPSLSEKYRFVAIDLPGHGHSDWLGQGGDYYIWESIAWVSEVLNQFSSPVHLLGHSMGAAASIITAATFPELVRSVVMLDAAGPLATPSTQAAEQMRKGIDEAVQRSRSGSRLKTYADVESALKARVRQDPALSPECIAPVVVRNLKNTPDGYQWRTDPRLRHTSKLRMTEDLVQQFMSAVGCPVLVVKAADTFIPESFFAMRMEYLKNGRLSELPGHHHFHLEPETALTVARDVLNFYQEID